MTYIKDFLNILFLSSLSFASGYIVGTMMFYL